MKTTQIPATHTPTPYSAKGRFIYSAATHYAAPEGNKIAEVVWNSEVKNNPEQDAALIVRAVNSHAQLVAALENLVTEAIHFRGTCIDAKHLNAALDAANAALSAAQK